MPRIILETIRTWSGIDCEPKNGAEIKKAPIRKVARKNTDRNSKSPGSSTPGIPLSELTSRFSILAKTTYRIKDISKEIRKLQQHEARQQGKATKHKNQLWHEA